MERIKGSKDQKDIHDPVGHISIFYSKNNQHVIQAFRGVQGKKLLKIYYTLGGWIIKQGLSACSTSLEQKFSKFLIKQLSKNNSQIQRFFGFIRSRGFFRWAAAAVGTGNYRHWPATTDTDRFGPAGDPHGIL